MQGKKKKKSYTNHEKIQLLVSIKRIKNEKRTRDTGMSVSHVTRLNACE